MRPICSLLFISLTACVSAQPTIGTDISPIGCQVVWPADGNLNTYLDRLQEAGVDTVRCDAMWWGLVEYPAGQYHWDGSTYPDWTAWDVDNWVAQVTARGLEPYVVLGLGNAEYDPDGGGNWDPPTSPTSVAAFAAYCYAAADRYQNEVDIWEIWNEPNTDLFWGDPPNAADYVALVVAGAAQVRAADPTATILGGVTAGLPLGRTAFEDDYIVDCFDAGLLNHIDVLSVHPYRSTAPETVATDITYLRNLMNTYPNGSNVAIWSGEWGYNSFDSEVDEPGQAKSLLRMMLNNPHIGIDLSIWFSIHAFQEKDISGTDSEWGLLNRDLTRRPSWYAMQVVNDHLPTPVTPISDPHPITFSPSLSNQTVRVFERGSADHRTAGIWLARWPVNSTFTPETTQVNIPLAQDFEVLAFDGMSGDELWIDRRWNSGSGRLELYAFDMHDYPILLDIDRETLPPGSNVASTYAAFATSTHYDANYDGDKALDGVVDANSKWTSDGSAGSQWLAVDLGVEHTVTGTALRLPSLAGEFASFNAEAVEIQVGASLTGPWTTVVSETNPLQHDRIITPFPSPETARYVRLLVTDPGIDAYVRIQEFEIYSTGAVPAELTTFRSE